MQNKVMARVLATMMAATAAVSAASVPMMVAPIVAMAEDIVAPKAAISVMNVEEGAKVTAYQLVEGAYSKSGETIQLNDYVLTDIATRAQYDNRTVTVEDLAKVDSAEAGNTDKLAAWTTAVASKITASDAGIDMPALNDPKTTYATTAEPGLYLVLITKADSTSTYNPVLLAVNIKDANDVKTDSGSTVEGSNVVLDGAYFQNGSTTAYAKKTTNGVTKVITKDGAEVKGITATVGDTISSKITGTIPSYSDFYASPTYKITDTPESGCYGNISNLKITVGGTELTIDGGDIKSGGNVVGTLTGGNDSANFTISFTSDYLKGLSTATEENRKIEVTYNTTVAAGATQNFAENHDHATVEYSYLNASNAVATETIYDNTWVYTFGVDKDIDSEGNSGSGTYIDYTLNKVSGTDTFEDATKGGLTTKKSKKAITSQDAKFKLYSDADCTTELAYKDSTKVSEATSDEIGHISFDRLRPGTYYLKETAAPKDYTLSTIVYTIVISEPTIAENGTISSYTITTTWNDGSAQSKTTTVSATGSTIDETTGSITYTGVTASTTPVEIINTTLQQLPFTGGAGRYAIYIGSVALAAVFVILFIVWKRREQDEQ